MDEYNPVNYNCEPADDTPKQNNAYNPNQYRPFDPEQYQRQLAVSLDVLVYSGARP